MLKGVVFLVLNEEGLQLDISKSQSLVFLNRIHQCFPQLDHLETRLGMHFVRAASCVG